MVLICCWSFGEEFSRFVSYRLRQITFGKGFIVFLLKGRNNLLLLGKLSQSALEESFQVFFCCVDKKKTQKIYQNHTISRTSHGKLTNYIVADRMAGIRSNRENKNSHLTLVYRWRIACLSRRRRRPTWLPR